MEGMGPLSTVTIDLGSSTGIHQGHIQTTVLGQTSMGGADCQSWDRTGAHLGSGLLRPGVRQMDKWLTLGMGLGWGLWLLGSSGDSCSIWGILKKHCLKCK